SSPSTSTVLFPFPRSQTLTLKKLDCDGRMVDEGLLQRRRRIHRRVCSNDSSFVVSISPKKKKKKPSLVLDACALFWLRRLDVLFPRKRWTWKSGDLICHISDESGRTENM
ncbi:unnamed protein product, partial [Musa acuminata var. zebrina]